MNEGCFFSFFHQTSISDLKSKYIHINKITIQRHPIIEIVFFLIKSLSHLSIFHKNNNWFTLIWLPRCGINTLMAKMCPSIFQKNLKKIRNVFHVIFNIVLKIFSNIEQYFWVFIMLCEIFQKEEQKYKN